MANMPNIIGTRLEQAKRSHHMTSIALEIAERLQHWDIFDRDLILDEVRRYLDCEKTNEQICKELAAQREYRS